MAPGSLHKLSAMPYDRRAPGARAYDLLILDAPATGHGVAVLSAPHTFARTAREDATVGALRARAAAADVDVTRKPRAEWKKENEAAGIGVG